MAEMADVETATNVSLEGIPEEPIGEDSVEEMENLPSDVLHAEHEALALQYRAKQKMAEVRKMRNFYKKPDSDVKKSSKGGKCFVCDEQGHYARDCPKVKAALASTPQNPVMVAATATKKDLEEDPEHQWSLLAEICKDSQEASSDRVVYMVQLSRRDQGHDTNVIPFDTWWNMQELAKKVIMDLGCM